MSLTSDHNMVSCLQKEISHRELLLKHHAEINFSMAIINLQLGNNLLKSMMHSKVKCSSNKKKIYCTHVHLHMYVIIMNNTGSKLL